MYDAPSAPTSTCFDVTIADNIAHIVLKRPEAFNSMTPDFWNDFPKIIKDINDNARARVIVITSTGKHFCSGMDLAVFSTGDGVTQGSIADRETRGESFRRHVHYLQDCFSCMDEARVPVLVAIQGGCIGGAVDFISATDIRWASKDAFFCIQEVNIGMTADVGTFPRLCKLIPEGWVREMAYTGRRLGAQKAKEIGLVNELFDTHEELVAHVLATAREIASKAPLAVTGSKLMINYARDHSIRDSLDYIATWQAGMFSPSHMAEAFRANAAKEPGQFPDLLPLRNRM
ncbi:short-chain-enoyl-CoA hydratase [Candidatus Phycosocius bacilliformis]|uniref:Short-chain-enoyl-CoA hydratase n=1 Tax=Candidatus Phycosocius bacilliformis TaxID=1445552 RepID=A0A2P2E9K3_9PROT|nr:crotonase/enoyl-CoA hydratase family protein [Candidatus Phycosocius bacilliformis]GBF57750.1 short-chain-enoyl-CoA hydratase [Candidatus Phycosocius bacilliformis]